MFNVGSGELLVILVIALIVLGPDKLPEAVRKVGRVYGELRRMSSGFQAELRDVLDEPMREVRSTTDMMRSPFSVDELEDEDATLAADTGPVEAVSGDLPDPPLPAPVPDELRMAGALTLPPPAQVASVTALPAPADDIPIDLPPPHRTG